MEHDLKDPSQFLGNATIDWLRIGRAVRFYQNRGYHYVEVPWVVPSRITNLTAPLDSKIYSLDDNMDLVGSAEQSFLWLAERDELWRATRQGTGQKYFVSVTPCFRGDTISPLHQNSFMKVELFCTHGKTIDVLRLAFDAYDFFRSEGVAVQQVDRMSAENSIDLQVCDIEVGSYGIRSRNDMTWAYGTGLAEPRFSVAKRKDENGR